MNNNQLQNRIEKLRRQLTAMRQMFVAIENMADEGFTGYDDQWPSSLEHNLHLLEQMFRRFREAQQEEDFLESLIAGRPNIAELIVASDSTAKKAAAGFRTASETLNLDDSPGSGFTSWHWFEHAFQNFLTTESRCLSTLMDMLHRESKSENAQAASDNRHKN